MSLTEEELTMQITGDSSRTDSGDDVAEDVAEQSVLAPELKRLSRQTGEGSQELRPLQEIVIAGGPWPELEGDGQTMIINMGPQHPSTHGVLRMMMELDGETVVREACNRILAHGHGEDRRRTYLCSGRNQRHSYGLRLTALERTCFCNSR